MAKSAETYLKPEVIRQVARLDLRAKFIVEGFISGLHRSPYQGFSVEFSEHRKYVAGDDPSDIDWLVYAKTDKFYVKKFESETNVSGLLVMDLSASMGYTHSQKLSKFEYATSLSAALAYMMIHQQDPVGLITFDDQLRDSLAPHSRRGQLGAILGVLSRLEPKGLTDIAGAIHRVAAMIKHRSIVMIFSDFLADSSRIFHALHHLRHRGNDVILFHILDEAETQFPFTGMVQFEEPETGETLTFDASGYRDEYLAALEEFTGLFRMECLKAGVDYVLIDTSTPFDKALLGYLVSRKSRF